MTDGGWADGFSVVQITHFRHRTDKGIRVENNNKKKKKKPLL
jgi:hypothetical protein